MTLLRRLAMVGAILGTTAALAVAAPSPAAAVTDLEPALRWAPIHYQDTDSSDYDADYLTAVNYDAEWDMLNNWWWSR